MRCWRVRERIMLRTKILLTYFAFTVAFAGVAQGQSLPKVRAAYTSISIQFDAVYIMKELNLPRKYGLDAEILFVPVSSRAVQAALAGGFRFFTSGGVTEFNTDGTGDEFARVTRSIHSCV